LTAPALGLPVAETKLWWLRLAPSDRGLDRAHLLADLERTPGQHLVVVRYGQTHDPLTQLEWVYNAADLDGAKVVWAREMRPDKTAQLLEHYRDRHVWLLEPDQQPVRLLPYPGAGAQHPAGPEGTALR